VSVTMYFFMSALLKRLSHQENRSYHSPQVVSGGLLVVGPLQSAGLGKKTVCHRAYPSVTNAPRMAPAATPLIDPAVNQPHARARGMGAWIEVPNPTEVPRASPRNKPSSRPARSDFGLTRSR